MRRWITIALSAMLTLGVAAPAAAGPPRHLRVAYVHMGRVHVLQVGSSTARQVLVLEAGQFGAAGDFRALATTLARRRPDTQVWAVDRRETGLEDLTGFAAGTPDRAADYYLGDRYRRRPAPQAGRWGLAATLDDLHGVIRAARSGGRRVVLGGHSWGATIALAYAAWDFAGRPGYRDLSGLVLIDGGMHDAFAGEGDLYRLTPTQAREGLAQIKAGTVFDPALTMGRTETYAIMMQLAAQYAKAAPSAPSTLAATLPDPLRPSAPVTNLGLIDYLYATHPLVPDLSVNTAYTPVTHVADALAGPVPGAFEWDWPQRLTLDLEAADQYAPTATTDLLGLRLWHASEVDVPLYSFQTGLTHGSVNLAAQWVVTHSRIPIARYAGDDAMTHLDPLWATPSRNTMLDTIVPFLDRVDHPASR